MDIKNVATIALLVLWVLLFTAGVALLFGKKIDWLPLMKSLNALKGRETKISKKTEYYIYLQDKFFGIAFVVVALYMIYFTISFYFEKNDILNLPIMLNNLFFPPLSSPQIKERELNVAKSNLNPYFLIFGIYLLIQGVISIHPQLRGWSIKLVNSLSGTTTKITAATNIWHILRGLASLLVGGLILYSILIQKTSISIP
ncbi:MAG: hypothetical protein WC826_03740 [Microgenomates group bacterium]